MPVPGANKELVELPDDKKETWQLRREVHFHFFQNTRSRCPVLTWLTGLPAQELHDWSEGGDQARYLDVSGGAAGKTGIPRRRVEDKSPGSDPDDCAGDPLERDPKR
eukprot:3151000-Rhodomonas_salina.3